MYHITAMVWMQEKEPAFILMQGGKRESASCFAVDETKLKNAASVEKLHFSFGRYELSDGSAIFFLDFPIHGFRIQGDDGFCDRKLIFPKEVNLQLCVYKVTIRVKIEV